MAFDLSQLELSPETEAFLPLRADDPPLAEQRRFGTWWIAPLARVAGADLLGFRMMPGKRLADCPIVWASGPAAVTIATRVDRTVPVIVFSQMARSPHSWRDAMELLDVEWDELITAHRALGGTDALAVVRSLAGDESLRRACQAPGPARDEALTLAFEQLDPAPANRSFRRALLARTRGEPLPAVPDAGVWAAALDSLAYDPSQAALDLRRGRPNAAAAWRMFSHPAGLDATWGYPLEPWPEPSATDAAKRLHAAARLLVAERTSLPPEVHADPLWRAVTELAAAESPFDFHGVPFIEAPAALDEQGHPERALHALTAVEFWNFLAGSAPMDGAIEAAHELAKRNAWAALSAITGAVVSVIPEEGEEDPDADPDAV